MFRVFGNAWKIEDLKKKILFTILILVLYRLGSAIPVPYVNGIELAKVMDGDGTLVGYFNMLSGYAFSQGTLFALGVSPYITSSIVMQLLTIAIPALERMSKNGPEGQAKIQRITRWVTVALAVITGYGYYITVKSSYPNLIADGWFPAVVIVVALTAGSSLVMWTGERIDDKGIGNGISMILFANIVSRGGVLVGQMFTLIKQDPTHQIFWVLLAVIVMLAIVALTVFFSNSERRLNVQYAKRQVGRKMYGGMSTHLPIKVLMSGVMPIIFANAIVMMPATLAMLIPSWKAPVEKWFSTNSEYPFYVIVMFVLIVAFAYFYLSISFNTVEVANNLKKNGGTILGYRPGKPTADYIKKVVNRVTLMGSVFLSFMAIFPVLLSWTGQPALASLVFGGTSMIIVVSVALETSRQLESEITMRHYKGFLD